MKTTKGGMSGMRMIGRKTAALALALTTVLSTVGSAAAETTCVSVAEGKREEGQTLDSIFVTRGELLSVAMEKLFAKKVWVKVGNRKVLISMPFNLERVDRLSQISKKTGADVVKIAETQLGYEGEIKDGICSSYFSNLWDPEISERNNAADGTDCSSKWCSEFAYWCLVKAKILDKTADIRSVKGFRKYFSNSMYDFFASSKNTKTEKRFRDASADWFSSRKYKSQGTLKIDDLKPGDILQIMSGKTAKEPHHTAIYVGKADNTHVKVIEGNMKDGRNAKTSKVRYGTYVAHEVIAVIRPYGRK